MLLFETQPQFKNYPHDGAVSSTTQGIVLPKYYVPILYLSKL